MANAQSDRQLIRQGNKQFRAGNYAESEVLYRKAVEKNPRNSQAYFNLGNALLGQRKDSSAVSQFEASAKLETNPIRKAKAYHNMGVVCQGKKMFGEAIEAYKEALRNNPTDDETRYNLALCKQQQQQQQQNQDNQKQDKQQQQQQPQPQQSEQKKDAERLLKAMENNEKKTMKEQQLKAEKSSRRIEKDW
ncbi:MAG: tetratricopeptide repeat protein [Bacteroidales bacterium]|nr:tetratricopeptide repeat protein [Bacteroidales bacterium]